MPIGHRGLAVLLAAGSAAALAAGDAPAERPIVSFTSLVDNVLNCKAGATLCRVTVRVEVRPDGGCEAIIDPHQIRIRKKTPVDFLVVRSTMTDTATYAFVSPGIAWTGTPPTVDQLRFLGLSPDRTVAQWATGKTKTSSDLGFVPLVKRVSDDVLCGAGDPVIANDG